MTASPSDDVRAPRTPARLEGSQHGGSGQDAGARGREPHGGHAPADEAIAERRRRGPCEFALLIPDATDRKRADWTLENAPPLLRKAAGRPVEGIVGHSGDPFASVTAAVSDGAFDEIIISTFSKKTPSGSVAIS